MKYLVHKFSLLAVICMILPCSLVSSEFRYLHPKPGASWVPREAPVIVRFENTVPREIQNLQTCVMITGSKSGHVPGEPVISSDERTLIVRHNIPFMSGEKIDIDIQPVVKKGQVAPAYTYSFFVAPVQCNITSEQTYRDSPALQKSVSGSRYPKNKDGVIILNGVSVPSDFPFIDISVNDNPDTGYIFTNYQRNRYFNLILDNQGAPYFYWIVPDDRRDFKVQPNGTLTMTVRQGYGGGGYIAVDNTYAVVDTFFAPEGYTIDEHELVVMENGHYLVTALDQRIIDMSQKVQGGKKNATVTGYHLIEMDARDNPVMISSSWDYYDVTDAEYVDLTQYHIDYLHTNSIAVDLDGHYLVCPKYLNEITKISAETGMPIWRLGGKKNQFEYIGFDDFIYMQHSIRVLPNGNYTVFDNGNHHHPHYSRALEFKVDEEAMTVTKIWEFRDNPDKQSFYKGNVQRLPNGNTLINWGMAHLPKLTEVRPDGSKAFEMNFQDPIEIYRVFRFPWQGIAPAPFLVIESETDRVVLLFNKFGDPDVSEYRVYGGPAPAPADLLGTTPQPYYIMYPEDFTESSGYYFRITAVSHTGTESGFSNEEYIKTRFVPLNVNLLKNGTFSSGMNSWQFSVSETAAAVCEIDQDVFDCRIQNGGTLHNDISLIQDDVTLIQGQTYRFEFDVRADQSRPVHAVVESSNAPYVNYSELGMVYAKTTKTHINHTFLMTDATDTRCRVAFYLGGETDHIILDNVSLKRIDPTDVSESDNEEKPESYMFGHAFPNPFNSSTSFHFYLSNKSRVTFDVIDVSGRTVQSLDWGCLPAGRYRRSLDGRLLVSGIYFCRIQVGSVKTGTGKRIVRKIVMLK